MKAVFINHCHPDMPHICATRVREFAQAMAGRGHEIILLTETLDGSSSDITPSQVVEQIETHDFSGPFNLACPPSEHRAIEWLRCGALPWGIRQSVIVWYFAKYQGVVTNWRHGCEPFLDAVVAGFKPDIAWASFGNTDCWNIAKDLAAAACCPWVADIKDPWGLFVPRLFRQKLAQHYNDAAAMTCFSDMHNNEARQWFGTSKSTIYSGFKNSVLTTSPRPDSNDLQILLTGAIYDESALNQLSSGIVQWINGLDESCRKRVKFLYAGSEGAAVQNATMKLRTVCLVDNLGYLPLDRLQTLQRQSLVNAYIKSERTFHHKLIELMGAQRPILTFPKEIQESKSIAKSVGIPLYACQTVQDVAGSLESCRRENSQPIINNGVLETYSWESQAIHLENVLLKAINEK